jgi:hypothetical protein
MFGRFKFLQTRAFPVGLLHHAPGKYLLVPWCGQVLARSVVLIKYLLLVQNYGQTLYAVSRHPGKPENESAASDGPQRG